MIKTKPRPSAVVPVDDTGHIKSKFKHPDNEARLDLPLRLKKEDDKFLINKRSRENAISNNKIHRVFIKYIQTSLLLQGKPLIDYINEVMTFEELG